VSSASGPPDPNAIGGPHYLLRPSVEVFIDRHGALCFVRPGGQDRIVRDPDAVDVAIVRRLQRSRATVETLAHDVGVARAVAREKVDSLVAADLVLVKQASLEPPLPDDDAKRFSRQLPYLAELGDEVRLQRRLRDSHVAVLGCGGIGTWAIAALACIGVGRLVLVDDDRVALSNLNRQILYTHGDVGAEKVAASACWLRAFDPAIDVSTSSRRIAGPADVASAIEGADVVVLAADQPPYEISRWVNTACVETRVPFIFAGQLPPVIRVGPIYVPGDGACYRCHEAALVRDSLAYEDYVAFRASEVPTVSTLGPACSVAGGLMGLELLHLLTGHTPVTRDVALLVHMRTLEVRREPVTRDPTCATCKHLV
jgi:molybdopterin-synthase adenylyltransferase